MKTGIQDHLNDDQFTDLLIGGALTEDCQRHLSKCAVCRSEAEKFTNSVGMFSTTSLAWSRTKPQQKSLRTIARWTSARAGFAPIGWALTAALLIAVGVPAWNDSHPNLHLHAPATQAPADSLAETAQDNQLMQSVNLALNTSDASPLPEYRLVEGSRPMRMHARLR